MKKELEDALAEKYEFMKPKTSLQQQKKKGCIHDLYGAFGCECSDGWYDLLNEMCAKIQAVYDKNNMEPDIVILQVKEKWGKLRFYYHFPGDNPGIHAFDILGGPPSLRIHPGKKENHIHKEIAEIVAWGEKRSGEICEKCGKPGKLRNDLIYILTLCDDCYEKAKKE